MMSKLLRKIHLWLSVPFGIVITLVCFSGSMLVFEKEITEWLNPSLYRVREVGAEPLPLHEIMAKVQAILPDTVQATGITILPDAQRTWQVSLSAPRRASLYVDPYTAEVVGRSGRLPFFDMMFRLHRWLLGPSQHEDGGMPLGRLLVGVSTIVLVVILLTGILMWLTHKRKPRLQAFRIRVTQGWPCFWHDLHVAGGLYATLFLLLLALTGLTWSFSWYRSGFYVLFGAQESAETAVHAHGGEGTRGEDRDMRGRNGGYGRRGEHGGRHGSEDGYRHGGEHGHRHGGEEGHGWRHRHVDDPYAFWQQSYLAVAQKHPGFRQITVKQGAVEVIPAGRNSLRAADTYTFSTRHGELSEVTPYHTQPKAQRLRGTVYTLHVGSWGGLITRCLTFLCALLGATLPLTGYWLWIRRLVNRRRGRQSPH